MQKITDYIFSNPDLDWKKLFGINGSSGGEAKPKRKYKNNSSVVNKKKDGEGIKVNSVNKVCSSTTPTPTLSSSCEQGQSTKSSTKRCVATTRTVRVPKHVEKELERRRKLKQHREEQERIRENAEKAKNEIIEKFLKGAPTYVEVSYPFDEPWDLNNDREEGEDDEDDEEDSELELDLDDEELYDKDEGDEDPEEETSAEDEEKFKDLFEPVEPKKKKRNE